MGAAGRAGTVASGPHGWLVCYPRRAVKGCSRKGTSLRPRKSPPGSPIRLRRSSRLLTTTGLDNREQPGRDALFVADGRDAESSDVMPFVNHSIPPSRAPRSSEAWPPIWVRCCWNAVVDRAKLRLRGETRYAGRHSDFRSFEHRHDIEAHRQKESTFPADPLQRQVCRRTLDSGLLARRPPSGLVAGDRCDRRYLQTLDRSTAWTYLANSRKSSLSLAHP